MENRTISKKLQTLEYRASGKPPLVSSRYRQSDKRVTNEKRGIRLRSAMDRRPCALHGSADRGRTQEKRGRALLPRPRTLSVDARGRPGAHGSQLHRDAVAEQHPEVAQGAPDAERTRTL